MKPALLGLLALLSSLTVLAQEHAPGSVVSHADQMPKAAYDVEAYLRAHVQYPAKAAHNVQGVVYLLAVVDASGKVTQPEVTKGLGYGCDEEAVRVVQTLPTWQPGRQAGKPVAVRVPLAVRFKVPPPAFRFSNMDTAYDANQAYRFVEVMPRPAYDLEVYLKKSTQYPPEARQNRVFGTVYVDFEVDTTGAIGHVTVRKGLSPGCDVEALRVIANMPPWVPGRQGDRTIPVWVTQPVVFSPPDSK